MSKKNPNDVNLKPINAFCTKGFYNCLMSLVSHLQQIDMFVDSPFVTDLKPLLRVWNDLLKLKSDQIVIIDDFVYILIKKIINMSKFSRVCVYNRMVCDAETYDSLMHCGVLLRQSDNDEMILYGSNLIDFLRSENVAVNDKL